MDNKLVQLRKDIAAYYGDPVMTKVKENGFYSVYKVRITSYLVATEPRYLVAITINDPYPIFHRMSLSDMKWISFQARQVIKGQEDKDLNLAGEVDLPYENHDTSIVSVYDKIYMVNKERDDDYLEYKSFTFPVKILVVCNKERCFNYKDEAQLEQALRYFNTVIMVNQSYVK
jgi:hypothetical protein